MSAPPDLTGRIVVDTRARTISTEFSEVFKGRDISSNIQVAIKRFRYGDASPEHKVINRELQALSAAKNPHVLRLLGTCTMDFVPGGISFCIVTPWAEQRTIKLYLEGNPSANRRQLLTQTARGLAYLHGLSKIIIHGDIHSGNVLIDSEGNAMLADFGLCKIVPPGHIASLTNFQGERQGKYPYLAPELHEAGVVRSTATDVFAFAILVWEVYTGTPPFPNLGGGAISSMVRLSRGDRPRRSEVLDASFSGTLWRLVSGCWAQDPSARPTMQHAVSVLEA